MTRFLLLGYILFLFIPLGCDKQTRNALRVAGVNDGVPLVIDIIDLYTIKVDDEDEIVEVVWDHYAPVELVYAEIGLGLPTAPGTYTAHITDYEITFKDITPGLAEGERFKPAPEDKVKGKCNIYITSDPAAKKMVKEVIKVVPIEFIVKYEAELTPVRVLGATIKFRGKDLLTENELEAEGYLTIDIGDYDDDPKKKEPPRIR